MKPHEDAAPGNGIYPEICDALSEIMKCVIPSMFKAQQPWALMGSLASVLQGVPDYRPPDIDLVTTMEGAYMMEGCMGMSGVTVRQVNHSSAGPYTSYFGIFEVNGVKTEIMGDLEIHCADGSLHARDHFSRWSDKVRILHFRDLHIPVVPLEWQLVANALLDRPERVSGISRYLCEYGYDLPYVQELLEDQQYGARTIRMVREAMSLSE